MEGGEPGWIKAMDRGLARPLAHHGTEASIILAILFGFVAVAVYLPALARAGVVVAVLLGLYIWLAEDFGAIFTASATDVNSGLPLMLLAAAYWPLRSRSAAS
jgi:hypothetical protein